MMTFTFSTRAIEATYEKEVLKLLEEIALKDDVL
ncbi:MAG: hypothetical protein DRN03_06390 [Thermoplasmata archaeon]|nr:MAG: hypothetical protein DRN03_06390 [Thermoplasmata archaeon]